MMALSVERAAFEQDWRYHHAVYDALVRKAKGGTGADWEWSGARETLRPLEFDTLLVLQFTFSWENSGSFVDTVWAFDNLADDVDRAFRRLGFAVASALTPRALELHAARQPYDDGVLPMPADLAAEVERVNEAATADVSEERLTKAIVDRAALFDL